MSTSTRSSTRSSQPKKRSTTSTTAVSIPGPQPITGASALPFGMAPAPAKPPAYSRPIDLGDYTNGEYAGWMVVLDFSVDIQLMAGLGSWVDSLQDLETLKAVGGDQSAQARRIAEMSAAMAASVESICVYWNFTKTDEHGETYLLPQPREGGAKMCPYQLLGPISAAFAANVQPPKAS